ncbi:MAG: type II toxin-antitoxin system VapC family toxin [Solirubrobacteraceae bacterium]
MILVDTSVWIDHLRAGDAELAAQLEDRRVLGHPWITGELALGQPSARKELLSLLANLPQAEVASTGEVLALIERRQLYGRGIGYVDAQLLAATLLTQGTTIWTRDKRLGAAAADLGVADATRSP